MNTRQYIRVYTELVFQCHSNKKSRNHNGIAQKGMEHHNNMQSIHSLNLILKIQSRLIDLVVILFTMKEPLPLT